VVNQVEACQLLAAAGARVEANRAFIPPHIIKDALVSVPRTFTIWGRDGVHPIQVANERVYFGARPARITRTPKPASGANHGVGTRPRRPGWWMRCPTSITP
jgi:hypothetical protein